MDRRKEVTAAKLTDDLVVDILSRLTYKDFCRCKCAYKAWSAFSSDPDYRKRLPKKVTTGLLYQARNTSAIPLVSLSRDDGEIDGILADVPHYEHLEFLDCCNGLVLCKYKSSYTSPGICRFVVCNPATREWRILPDTFVGTDGHRRTTILAFDPSWSPHFYVFSFNRILAGKVEMFSSAGSAWLVDDEWDSDIAFSWGKPHLFLNGMLCVEIRGQQVLVFEGLETMSDGILPYHYTIDLPFDCAPVSSFTDGCFDKSSGILHYALPDRSGHSIVVWTLEDYAHRLWHWTLKCHLNMADAFGRKDLVCYDNGGIGGVPDWFWNCDYRILALELERELVVLSDHKTMKLISYNISTGELNEIRDGLEGYRYYVPCYSELPAQEPSV
ncbi:hypothetical protein CFC21_010256 [Triticum aestivum]|uniref:F-box domain-containing protein n=2 Tax=Triticum aestivum TaxID=4565 RepID=A0A3B5ZPC8_WHEAT|nr:hypothetical protein CFC21_010256 [Triticum aestivum]